MTAQSGSDAPADPQWHALHEDAVAAHFRVDPGSGLTAREARRRLAETGPNALPTAGRTGVARMLLNQFRDLMILILVAAAIVSGLVGEARDAIAIIVIVVLNAAVGAIEEFRAERALEALRSLAAPSARVRRDGRVAEVPSRDLVPGDIVLLEAGNRVPADLRLIDVHDLAADESALTGESLTVDKDTPSLAAADVPVGDRSNLTFKGTQITRGRASGIVVATGTRTELGQIAELLSGTPVERTPLQRRLTRFGRRLALVVLAVCATLFGAGLLRGEPVVLMFLTAVSLAVAAIPEALPAVVTVSLALGARKMVRNNALVRRLAAVETLGSVTYICADKTGTLTENRMRVDFVLVGDARLDDPGDCPLLGPAIALNNDVEPDAEGQLSGDPTEIALYEFAAASGFVKAELQVQFPRIHEVPFDSETKCMTTVHRGPDGTVAFLKGAPEAVLARCGSASADGAISSHSLDLQRAEALADEGYRLMAYGARRLSAPDEALDRGFELLAMAALIDRPRDSVPEAVAECRRAGIVPVMITGDHPGTALAIARRIGVASDEQQAVTGTELAAMEPAALAACVESTAVYARVDPAQKIRIVEALKARGQFVAMTGDGVNDAPALKSADIGVAMGKVGTDVARESADMVLLDDHFATIVKAVREGRRIYDNILKFIKYTMTSNSGEIWTMFIAPFLGLPIPLLPIHILWINLVTDGLPGLALMAEKSEPDVMRRPPRPPGQSIFSAGMWQHILWVGLLIGGLSIFGQAWAIGSGSENWRTVVFTVLTFAQLAHVLVIRSERRSIFSRSLFSNPAVLGAVALTMALQFAVIYLPPLQRVFDTGPLTLEELGVCLALPLVVVIGVEIEKALRRRR